MRRADMSQRDQDALDRSSDVFGSRGGGTARAENRTGEVREGIGKPDVDDSNQGSARVIQCASPKPLLTRPIILWIVLALCVLTWASGIAAAIIYL
jgi:hypothetical protein